MDILLEATTGGHWASTGYIAMSLRAETQLKVPIGDETGGGP